MPTFPGSNSLPPAFDARASLAHELGCHREVLRITGGPFETWRGLTADYTREGSWAGTVLVGAASNRGTGREGRRSVSLTWRAGMARMEIDPQAKIAW